MILSEFRIWYAGSPSSSVVKHMLVWLKQDYSSYKENNNENVIPEVYKIATILSDVFF
tara:strand:+ start:105 stop:278 length:174 start_codon:yes stop_codon:yes gene_type:complete